VLLGWHLDHLLDHPDDPTGPVWIDEALNVSSQIRLEPTRSTQSTRLRIWRLGVQSLAAPASRQLSGLFGGRGFLVVLGSCHIARCGC
jgi:hypothetical protein